MIHTLLLLGLFVLPIVGGLALIARHILSTDRGETRTRWGVTLTAGVVAFCAVALRFMGGDAALALRWLPGTGPMTLSLGSTSLLAAAATAAALGVTAAVVEPTSSLVSGTVLLALASGNVAFLSGHFLLRYGALELVGLFIAAAPLLQARNRGDRDSAAGVHAAWVYLLLRLGDAGLLTAILMLWTHTGTLEITPALAGSAALPIGVQAWVAGGFLLAVAVKIGLWPFHAWIHSEGRATDRS
jgi:formate hydrogenlyase subunit 3/multisubunit Na+/H+ antiporter MnhD subunit